MIDQSLPSTPRRWPIDHVKLPSRAIPSEVLLDDLRHVASVLGSRTVSRSQYEERGRFAGVTFCTRFGSWNVALTTAGLEVGVQRKIPETDLMENFAEVWLKLGRQPKITELRRCISKYSHRPYISRFGNFAKMLTAFAEWAGATVSLGKRPADDSPPLSQPARKLTSRTPSSRLRIQVLMRDRSTCRLCGARPDDGARLQIDHIIPWSKGGETVLENLQVLCHRCNIDKRTLDESPSPQVSRE